MGDLRLKKTETIGGVTNTTYETLDAITSAGDIVFDTRICMKSPDGSTWELKIDDAGVLTTTKIV